MIGNYHKIIQIFAFTFHMKVYVMIGFCQLSLMVGSQDLQLRIQTDITTGIKYREKVKNQADAEKEIGKYLQELYVQGYLAATVLSEESENEIITAQINAGDKYTMGKIRKGNAEEEMLGKTGFREKIYNGKILSEKNIYTLAESVLNYYENNGYPFATFRLDSIAIKNNRLEAAMNVKKNNLYRTDSIILKGNVKVSKSYLFNYLSLKEGDLYNEKLVTSIDKKIQELSFIELIKPTEIVFTKSQCFIYIYIKEKKASQFNGIIGLLQDAATGKITITGDARIRLKNALHSGELFDLNWRKLNNDIQDLKINVNYPFLFKTPFGTDLLFKLYRKDTTFLELSQNAGLLYQLQGGNFIKVSVNYQSSVLLTPEMFSEYTVLPDFADVKSLLYGIGSKYEKLDYRINPSKGFSIEADIRAGNKTIKKNIFLDPVVYENINLKTMKYFITVSGDYFISPVKRLVVRLGNQTAWTENENLFSNELFRFGGLKTLRGFNEESLFASFYTVNTAEIRFLLEQNSNIYVFYDHCYYERKMQNSFFHDTPTGFGAGISFQTKPGIFSLNYALGTEQGNPVLLRSAKIHFGFVNYF